MRRKCVFRKPMLAISLPLNLVFGRAGAILIFDLEGKVAIPRNRPGSLRGDSMNRNQRQLVERIARRTLGDEKVDEILDMPFGDLGFGYDQFGMERESAIVAYMIARVLYDYYFRVESGGHEHVPRTGRVIVAPNHSGMLPYDGGMIAADLLTRAKQARAMRGIVDDFAWRLPYIGLGLARVGQIPGARRNFEELLKSEELVVVFPEGARGTGKYYRERYQLQRFNVGFMELALVHQTPIVPCAVVGAEEQAPILFKVQWLARAMGIPYVPITPTFPLLGPVLGTLPYPTKYHISYGEPQHYYREYGPDAIHHPDVMRRLVDEYQEIVQDLVSDGVRDRKGVFI